VVTGGQLGAGGGWAGTAGLLASTAE